MQHTLTNDDLRSATWRRFTQALELKLKRLRELNDEPYRDAVETAGIRGEIKAVKQILALGMEPSASAGARPEIPVERIVELTELGFDPPY